MKSNYIKNMKSNYIKNIVTFLNDNYLAYFWIRLSKVINYRQIINSGILIHNNIYSNAFST